jgi:hypothetical protein
MHEFTQACARGVGPAGGEQFADPGEPGIAGFR